jgi:hypothetical protein
MWSKVKGFFSHSKTIVVARAYAAVGSLVAIHDVVAPIVSTTDVTPIAQKLPNWVWPLLVIATGIIFEWLRHVTYQSLEDNRQAAILTATPGLPA